MAQEFPHAQVIQCIPGLFRTFADTLLCIRLLASTWHLLQSGEQDDLASEAFCITAIR